ncbi:MAG TPA: folylpolyglutamate synthase/dihydrofolate synthase family protein [Pyrinomonadaceae bacterium]|nr:bifunctional folylpolyglutamate synthase/dihydrofolate synthase [Chloracidobacterium sp.]HRJ89909.1 folylpolyglutamate synthase/dihydrofolate synthase family protein [Pyrinomonadaceae bacterium]HRK51908.1 folylpolyglutamate synthase/dihydrofolate synthase family protein [Pyrinomonadaceae bacterium]
MNFDEANGYLLSLGNEVEAMKLGLENIRTLLTALGEPHENYLKVQVAGTNGKGSVCAFLDSICGEAGIRRGLYTSPHLVSITERIKIDGDDISESDFARLAALVRETSERLLAEGKLTYTPTFFEQVTAIALTAFAEAKVELAILETGLGGRLDATTAANAEIAAITRIGLDHQEYLGDTIEEIAAEKAAIIREQTEAVLIGRQSPPVMNVLRDVIGEAHRRGVFVRETAVVFDESALGMPLRSLVGSLSLRGAHQVENAEVAILVADALRTHFSIRDQDISAGLRSAIHPGRLEYQDNFLLDGAHNVAGAEALAAYLDEFVDKPITMIFGAMKEKDISKIAKILWPRAERVILTRPANIRALSPDGLLAQAPASIDRSKVVKTENVADALEKAREVTPPGGMILVTGSLYLVGEVKKLFNN